MRSWVKTRGEVCITNSRRIKVDNLAEGLKSRNHSVVWKKPNDLGHRSHGPLVIDVIEMVLFPFTKRWQVFFYFTYPVFIGSRECAKDKHRKGASR